MIIGANRIRIGLLALILGAVWAAASAPGVSAHAELLRSEPAANAELAQSPTRVDLWLSEPLEQGFSQARLFSTDGQEVLTGQVVFDPADPMHMTLPLQPLGPGIYTISWRTLSKADGHVYSGSFPFTVLNPDGTRPLGESVGVAPAGQAELPSLPDTLARWMVLLGSILLLGAPLFFSVVALSSGNPDPGENGAAEAPSRRLAINAIWLAVLAITVGHALQMALQAQRLGGLNQISGLLLGTHTGTLLLARQAIAATCAAAALRLLPSSSLIRRIGFPLSALAAAAAGVLLAANPSLDQAVLSFLALLVAALGWAAVLWPVGKGERAADRIRWVGLFTLAPAGLLTLSFGSHASAAPGSVWAVLVDFVHLLAASAWVGGLLLLPVLLVRLRRSTYGEQTSPSGLRLVQRFSYLASFSVFVLIMTGIFNSLVQLPDLRSLWDTRYGQVLVVKLAWMSLALGVAFLNNRLVHGNTVLGRTSGSPGRLDRQVTLEAGLSLLLMLSVAVLVQTTTPRSRPAARAGTPAEAPFYQVVKAGDLTMNVQILPNRVGYNRFSLNLSHEDSTPIGEVQRAEMRFFYLQASLGQASVVLEPVSPTTFTTEGAYLSQAGPWDITVYIQRRGMDDILARFEMEVPGVAAAPAAADPWGSPIPGIPPLILIVWLVGVVGIIPLVWRQPLEAIWPGLYALLRRAAFLFLIVGLVSGLVWLVLAQTAA